jgi:hypothetical protein
MSSFSFIYSKRDGVTIELIFESILFKPASDHSIKVKKTFITYQK